MTGEGGVLPRRLWHGAIVVGIAVGVVYVLSPLTVCFAAAMMLLIAGARHGLPDDDRRWVTALLVVAIVARVAAIAILFATTDHRQVPFGSFFGDEEYFIKRSIWLRNVALGIPIHAADLIYAFDDYSATSYLYVLAFVQILVGPSPYGVHLLGIAFYLTGSVLLYRMARQSFGPMPALVGLVVLLFLPSQFAWSISALKEPLFFMLTASTVTLAVLAVRARPWWRQVAAAAAIAAIAAVIETVRPFGAALSLGSVAAGLALAFVLRRPWLAIAIAAAAPIAAGAALSRPRVQIPVYRALQTAAQQHWGHVHTPGYVYKVLDDRFYTDRTEIAQMDARDTTKFVLRAIVSYVTVPLPWDVESRSALAFMPEQMIWYAMVLVAPFGIAFALRRDAVAAGVLLAHAAIAGLTVALVSGNVGTLVRHRGLSVPYLLWLSAVGACELLVRARRSSMEAPVMSVDRAWP